MAKKTPSKDRPRKKDKKRVKAKVKPKAKAPSRGKSGPKAKPADKKSHPPKGKAASKAEKAPAPERGAAGAKAAPAPDARTAKDKAKAARKSGRRLTLLRRGPDGEILAPGDLLLPGGSQRMEEIIYLFRGCSAAEHPSSLDEAVAEVFARRPQGEFPSDRDDIARAFEWARGRFGHGSIEPVVPPRANLRRTFQGVVERARHRRREIGAFLRGLDLGHTETSHMDAHGEASLQSLMEWAARLENLAEADEPNQADYGQFHRGLDQLESTTETLMVDVEQTLRRLRDRVR